MVGASAVESNWTRLPFDRRPEPWLDRMVSAPGIFRSETVVWERPPGVSSISESIPRIQVRLSQETNSWGTREERIRALRGKYSFIPTSSEEYARSKLAERV